MPAKSKLPTSSWLFSLFLASLVLFTDDYVIAGVLPELAQDLNITEGVAGQLITVFSVTVAFSAPVLAVTLAAVERKRLIVSALLVFACANIAAAFATSLGQLMVARVVAALCAAATTPSLFSTASALAPRGKIGRYLAVISFGVTGSIALGVPFGTWVGAANGWRWTFASMAIGGVLAALAVWALLPWLSTPTALKLKALLEPLVSKALLYGFLANFLNMAASMMLLTYLAPVLIELSRVDQNQRGLVFSVAGFAGMVGIWLGGIATDHWGSLRTLTVGLMAFATAMGLLTIFWALRPIPIPFLLVVVVLWAGSAFWNSPAIATRIFGLAGGAAQQAMAMNTSCTYLGVAAGGLFGGLILDLAGVAFLAPTSLLLGILSLGVLRLSQ